MSLNSNAEFFVSVANPSEKDEQRQWEQLRHQHKRASLEAAAAKKHLDSITNVHKASWYLWSRIPLYTSKEIASILGEQEGSDLIRDRDAAQLCLERLPGESPNDLASWETIRDLAILELERRVRREQSIRETQRRERITQQAAIERPSILPGRLCARCQKKEARIDDFCKKCARLEGIIVHGKIGTT